MLTVRSLGKFEMTDGTHVLNDEVLRSDMLKKLLIYILTHRDHVVTIQELSEALWQEDEVDNPTGALKNLMYRLRNLLKKVFGDASYIVTSQGAYAWNKDVTVDFDSEHFEEYCKMAKTATDKDKIVKCYEQAIPLYQGRFMENALEQHWAVTLSTYYHSMFLNAVKALAQIYMEEERFQDMEDITISALKLDEVDEELHCLHILALIRGNKFDLAMKSYEEATKILYDTLGIRNSSGLKKVQEELLQMRKGNDAETIEDIHEDMLETEESVGVYFCGYPVFKEIYRLEVRKNARLGAAEYIVLFTIELPDNLKTDNDKMTQFLIEQGMKNLQKSIQEVLRIGDVAARYSDSQFIILLPTCTYESSVAVAERVLNRFASYDKGKKVRIKTDMEQISEVNSTLVR